MKKLNETDLLRKALRIAAVEAFHTEVIMPQMLDLVVGTDKEYPTSDSWIRERIEYWMEEAERVKKG